MRYKRVNDCIRIAFVVGLALCCEVSFGIAAEDLEFPSAAGTTGTSEQEQTIFHYRSKGSSFLGYRWLSSDDSLKAAEYIYPHSSVTFGLDLMSCPLPYRYHVNAEFLSNYDFYADAGFSYKDHVLFRDILVGMHHNLDHLSYQYSGEPPDLVYADRNAGDDYDIDFLTNLLSLRLKASHFPFHTFLNHRHVEREGTVQQRFLLGDFSQTNKVSESRDINWKSNAVKLGANSHAGPVEIEYAYDQAKFDPGRNNILYDSYPASGTRPVDIYPHNVVPETESSAHSVKLHSSYTGGIVAAASLSNLYQKNNYSRTESTTWKGAVDFSWIPDPNVGLFFKYRHRNVDMDTPDSVILTGLNNSLPYSVREGVSYRKDVFSLSTRYRPLNILSLFATYEFSHLERKDVSEWIVLPSQSNIHTITFKAHAKPLNKVKVKASYEFKKYNDPSYNNTPDNSNKIRLTTTYTPVPGTNVYLEYNLSVTERDSLHYLINTDPAVLLENGERDGRRDQFLASLSTELSPKASLTASWFYQRWDVEQDLAYGKWLVGGGGGDLPYIDSGVLYADQSNAFSLALFYIPRKDITVGADATYTRIKGRTGYDDVVGGASFALSTFSELKASETSFSLEISKKLSKDWDIRLRSRMDIYNDKAYDYLDGNISTTTFSLKRHF